MNDGFTYICWTDSLDRYLGFEIFFERKVFVEAVISAVCIGVLAEEKTKIIINNSTSTLKLQN